MGDVNPQDPHEHPAAAPTASGLSSHQERKRTKQARKDAARARAADNMRMVAAAQAAGIVPKVVTRKTLERQQATRPSSPPAPALVTPPTGQPAAQAMEVGNGHGDTAAAPLPTSIPTPGPAAVEPATATAPPVPVDVTAVAAQAQSASAPELFGIIAERGLRVWNRSNSGTPAPPQIVEEILACEVQFCVFTRVAPSTTWTTTCLRPPFEQVWLEYPHLEMLCGALMTEIDANRYSIQFVTSGREGTKKPLWWPGAEIVDLAADGSLARRQPATSDPRNRVAKYQIDSVTGVFDAVYTHLSLIHELSGRNAAPTRVDTTAPVLPARSHELDGTVVLIWGEGPSGSGVHLDTPRHSPVGHTVRGHQRRLRDGGTTWVRPHRRGAEAPGGPTKSRVYQVKKDHGI